MGFTKPDLPDVDPETFMQKPLMERMRILATDWVDNGFGSPKMVHSIYIAKLVFLYALGGALVATLTSGLPFLHVSQWWNQPIVYEKAVLWTVLLELIGVAGSWGPLAGKIKPMTGGILFWARPGTIRLRPWKWVPLTGGDRRTWFDVGLYIVLMISVAVPLFSPGMHSDSLSAAMPANTSGLVNPALLIAPIALLVIMGLRDKIVFLAARGEQYLPALIIFTAFSFVDMIIALKLLIVVVWVGAGVSKLGLHFTNVIPPMVSNSPLIPFKWLKRAHYRNYPDDLRPSHLACFMAHVPGSVVEILAPLTLLFSTNKWVTLGGVVIMVCFHLFIISTFPLAVPLEWNVLFAYATIFLFWGFPGWNGYAITDMSSPWLTVAVVAALLFYPILGNFRPDKVSFLPSMRQYAGNWASAVWAFAPGAEAKLNKVTRTAKNQVDQFVDFGYEPKWADVTMQRVISWRTMHSQGRGLFSVLLKNLPDIDTRWVREGEFVCNSLIGFNFGDGHLHDEDMIAAVQREAAFEPGELVIVWVESQAWGSHVQHYKVIDAALGVVERGTWKVTDAVNEQPWLPNGPIPTEVTWSLSGKKPRGSRPRGAGMTNTAIVVGAGPNGWPPRSPLPRPASRSPSWKQPTTSAAAPAPARRSSPACCTTTARRSTRWPSGRSSWRGWASIDTACPGASRRSTASTRSTAAAPACCTARSRPPPTGCKAPTAPGGGACSVRHRPTSMRCPRTSWVPCCGCLIIPWRWPGLVRPPCCRHPPLPSGFATQRPGLCSEVWRRTPFGHCTTRCHRRSA